ncbi:hypothetical protein [Acinetobacter sp. YH12218]|uniref:hypothetical protein n=1 Tax=Acinetobacter sp. YH12218 TaxID=2601152 RepID=UPI0015D2D610|nr:hypothetical protein [Acinetobacter sp. YH12218]
MVTRGRPAKTFDDSELSRVIRSARNKNFRTKAQQKLCDIDNSRMLGIDDIYADDELLTLVKIVERQRIVYRKNAELYKIIQHKATTTIPLTSLEKEILGYDWKDRDGFFNCQKALTTYAKLEKIAKSEIERAESQKRQEAIKKTQEQQTEGQKRRKENERRKYFLGGVVLKYSQFLKDNYLFGPQDTEEAILHHLLEDFIVCNYLSDVTNDDENKAKNVRNSIKNNHSEIIEKIRNMAQDIENDKRK